jgi:hypothetical protein
MHHLTDLLGSLPNRVQGKPSHEKPEPCSHSSTHLSPLRTMLFSEGTSTSRFFTPTPDRPAPTGGQ